MYEKETKSGGEDEEEEKEMCTNDNHNLLNYLFIISWCYSIMYFNRV